MLKRSLVAVALALSFVVVVATAHAQARRKTVREELPPQAQTLWDDAVRLTQYSSPEWDKAAAKFQEAYDASHNPRVLFNVAVCERNLQHYTLAVAKFKQELAEGGSKLTAEDKAEIQSTIAVLERSISTVELTVSEPDAIVLLDGVKVGQTPLASFPADISSKPHSLRIEKDGFVPFEKRDLTVSSSAPVRVSAELEPKVKRSEVEIVVSGAPGAAIFIDGIDRGPAPFKGLVEAGPHAFEARLSGFDPAVQRQEVVYKQKLRLQLALARSVTTGSLRIETLDGASIEIDGKPMGRTVWEGTIEGGTHNITARKEGYNDGKIEIYLPKGETISRRIPLTSEKKNEWVFWAVGTVIVVAGVATVAGFVFAPKDQQPVIGTLDPGLVSAGHRIRF